MDAEQAVPVPAYAATETAVSAAPHHAADVPAADAGATAPMLAIASRNGNDDDPEAAESSSDGSNHDDPLVFDTNFGTPPWERPRAFVPASAPRSRVGAYSIAGPGSEADAGAEAVVEVVSDGGTGDGDDDDDAADNAILSAALGDAYVMEDDRVLDPSLVVAVRDDGSYGEDDGGVDAFGDNNVDDASQEAAERKGAATKHRRWLLIGIAAAVVAAIVAATVGTLAAAGGEGEASASAGEDGAVVEPEAYVHPERGCPPLKKYCSATDVDPSSYDPQDQATAAEDQNQCWEQLTCDLNYPGGEDLTNFRLSFSTDGSVLVASYLDDKYKSRNGKARAYRILPSSSASAASTWSPDATKGIDDEGTSVPARVVPLGRTFEGSTRDFLGAVVSGNGRRLATVTERPEDDPRGLITVYEYQEAANEWVVLGEPIKGEAFNDGIKWSLDLNDDGSVVAFGARRAGARAAGVARAYNYVQEQEGNEDNNNSNGDVTIGSWVKMGSDMLGQNMDDEFGRSVSLSSDGRTLAVGAWNNNGGVAGKYGAGQVRVYRFDGTSDDWNQMGHDIDGLNAGDQFGVVVSLSAGGTTVAASARGSDGPDHAEASSDHVGNFAAGEATMPDLEDSGSVRAFRYVPDNNEWHRLGEAIHGDHADDGVRSVSLSVDGTRLAYAGGQNWGRGYARIVEFVESRDDNDDGAVVAGPETLTSAYSTAVARGNSSRPPGTIAGEWQQVGGTVDIWSNEGGKKFAAVSVALAWPSIGVNIGANNDAAIVAVAGRDAVDEGLCQSTCPPTGVVRLFAASTVTN